MKTVKISTEFDHKQESVMDALGISDGDATYERILRAVREVSTSTSCQSKAIATVIEGFDGIELMFALYALGRVRSEEFSNPFSSMFGGE